MPYVPDAMDRFLAHLDRGWDLVTKGDTTGAFISARQALAIDEESAEGYNLLGYVYAMDGDLDQALSYYRKAMNLDEFYLDPVLNAVEILAHAEFDAEEAINLCQRIPELSTEADDLIEAAILEANALLSLGRTKEARQRLENIDNLSSLPAPQALLVGRIYYELGDLHAAGHLIEMACDAESANPDAWYYRGLIAREQGRISDAIDAFLVTSELDGHDPRVDQSANSLPINKIVLRGMACLDVATAARLEHTELRLEAHPSERQIRNDVDPRQVIFIDGVDATRGTVKTLWIFYHNLVRCVGATATIDRELAEMILQELEIMDERLANQGFDSPCNSPIRSL